MAVLPALPGGLGDVMPAAPGRAAFTRKNWDNPFKYKLNRAYGDEFEYGNFAQLAARWAMHTAVAADFRFDGGSSIQWKATAATSALYQALPPYDFDAVLEYSRDSQILNGSFAADLFPGIGIVDVNGTGFGVGVHEDGNLYSNALSTWSNPATFSHSVASGLSADPRHEWLCLRRVGGNIQGRSSNDGATWTALTTADAIGGTPVYLAIMRYRFTRTIPIAATLHRFNVYPAPGYMPT